MDTTAHETELSITDACPYCRHAFTARAILTEVSLTSPPVDVAAVPYSRDIGRFDPHDEAEERDPRAWSRVGRDYFRLLSWEVYGILNMGRDFGAGQDVRYRVKRCHECGNLFDIYISLKPGSRFSQFWPHLFGRSTEFGIEPYQGRSFLGWLATTRPRQTGGLGLVPTMILLALLCVPFGFAGETEEVSRYVAILTALPMLVGIAVMLVLYERLIDSQHSVSTYVKILDVASPKWAVHWRNFVRSRIVGAQPSRGVRVTQIDMPGIAATIVAAAAFAVSTDAWISLLLALAEAALLIGGVRMVVAGRRTRRGWVAIMFMLSTAPGIATIATLATGPSSHWLIDHIHTAQLFLIWLMFSYTYGVCYFIALSVVHYVLRGARQVPLTLREPYPWPGASDLGPLVDFHDFSRRMLAAIGIISVMLFTIGVSTNTPWIGYWLVTVTLVAALGLGISISKRYLVAAVLLVTLQVWVVVFSIPSIPIGTLVIDVPWEAVVWGVVFATVFSMQMRRAHAAITDILEATNHRWQRKLIKQRDALEAAQRRALPILPILSGQSRQRDLDRIAERLKTLSHPPAEPGPSAAKRIAGIAGMAVAPVVLEKLLDALLS